MDDVIESKVASIERCLTRIQEEQQKDDWLINYTHQDALLLNLERACQAAIDAASHIVRVKKLGFPKSSREVFELLAEAKFLTDIQSDQMKKMVGFRNIAIHDYSRIDLEVVSNILKRDLDNFRTFCQAILRIDR